MQSLYVKIKGGNFGDDLNRILWPSLLPQIHDIAPNEAILGIGTLQGYHIPPAVQKVHVLGTGGHEHPASQWIDERFQFHFVRGPLTAKNWGCEDRALIDGAALLMHSYLKDVDASSTRPAKLGFIPHHTSDHFADFAYISAQAGMKYITTLGCDVEQFIRDVKSCDAIVTEALHGAIIADLFRKPWIPMCSGEHIYNYKWDDWCRSVGLSYQPHVMGFAFTRGLSHVDRVENFFKRGLHAFGLGKKKWGRRRVWMDGRLEEESIAEQIRRTAATQSFILSEDRVMDRLIDQAGERFHQFAQQFVIR